MTSFCNERGITFITGVPYHPQGQKGVEVHFRTIIDMVITTLGGRHTTWAQKDLVDELIYTLNTSLCTSIQITSHEALFGRPPRTSVSTVLGTPFVNVLSAINLSPERWQDAVHFHHQQLHALQDLIALGSSAEQLATKAAYDARPRPAVYNIGDWVLILYSTHVGSFEPHRRGPFTVTRKLAGDFYSLTKLTDTSVVIDVHVSRISRFNNTRTTASAEAAFELAEGWRLVTAIQGHTAGDDGQLLFEVLWDNGVVTLTTAAELKRIDIFKQYIATHNITPAQLETAAAAAATMAASSSSSSARPTRSRRGRGRGSR